MQHECWTAALPSAGAEMSAAVDAAAQWTPRTPLEALASVAVCDEEDEDADADADGEGEDDDASADEDEEAKEGS